ncbi:hypothetical protein K1720_03000 [Thermococcus argininiproducens]|uniref:Uncharacterized protein n=1 Tax=Thermococcus argininiproducens TaxID=2866384 RepID=A0A9E7SD47_9EURY|nr:hypothetical protein [Thermococcus argininiproducens]USH00446.1 hypothetical protein K1720_03000 [Thermococcus argininiproducens]
MLVLPEVEKALERLKLKLLIQEKAKLTDAKVFDSVILFKNGHFLILLLFEEKPKKEVLSKVVASFPKPECWVLWRKRDKIYVQKLQEDEVISLQVHELDAFIELML